jgi:FtsP/CotA-like multicopper oxidase with cupredoxin domain
MACGLDNRFDGAPHDTQAPIPAGGSFTYRVHFPDAGIYWYHPHVREDYAQEQGLYGNIIVMPDNPTYWRPANRGEMLVLDDILLEDDQIAPFRRNADAWPAISTALPIRSWHWSARWLG